MKYLFDGFNDVVRLERGERLSEALEQFAMETKLPGAWVSGLGGVTEMTLGFYDLEKKEYIWRIFSGMFEVTNLTGSLAWDESDKPIFHLHGTFGDREYQTVGGHVKDLVAGATLELFIHRTYKPLKRKADPTAGLPLLDL